MFEDTDVAFFDVENPVESLLDIFESGFEWDEGKRERFLDKCSGQRNLPKFWEHVTNILDK